jgi:hypothetical protein
MITLSIIVRARSLRSRFSVVAAQPLESITLALPHRGVGVQIEAAHMCLAPAAADHHVGARIPSPSHHPTPSSRPRHYPPEYRRPLDGGQCRLLLEQRVDLFAALPRLRFEFDAVLSHQTNDPTPDRCQQTRDLDVARRPRRRHEPQPRRDPTLEHPFGHQGMKVDVHIESRATSLDGRHRSPTAVYSLLARQPALEAQKRPRINPKNRAAQTVVVGQAVPQAVGQRQYPLAHRHRLEHTVDEMSRT